MLKQYSTLTNCLAELRKSDLPVIEKLRIEVQLIQAKRILLDPVVETRVAGKAKSERDFEVLHERLRSLCRTGGVPGELEGLKQYLDRLKEELHRTADSDAPHPLHLAPLRDTSAVFPSRLRTA